ncbi:MAG TPA: hypothetical protein VK928_02105, partial [Longimicrobiales bacterium]|nr:hypothetical protein [Longimicrobiales bacterium]
MSARPAEGSRVALFAVPQMIHVRFEDVGGEWDSNTEAAVEIGLRYAGDSFHGGVSTTPMTGGGYRWKSLDFTAGVRTGAPRDNVATVMGDTVRDRFAFSAGAMWASSGDNEVTQCGAGPGLSAG